MKAFRERLSTYDDGFYQPTMINGNLYFVHSEGNTDTARDSGSATNLVCVHLNVLLKLLCFSENRRRS